MYTVERKTLESLFITAYKAALSAGNKIMEIYYSGEDSITVKSDNSPFSMGDQLAHKIIKEKLNSTRIPIVSEEGRHIHYDERSSWDMLWMIDPLDGTRQFIKKSPYFTVNIALIIDRYPVLGIIYAPALNVLYFGHKNYGSAKMEIQSVDEILNLSIDEILNKSKRLTDIPPENVDSYTILVSQYHTTAQTLEYINSMKERYPNLSVKSIGSSLKMCLLAENKANVYIRHHCTYEWDTAAAQAILEGAGCSIRSIDSMERLSYNKESLLNPWFICSKEGSEYRILNN